MLGHFETPEPLVIAIESQTQAWPAGWLSCDTGVPMLCICPWSMFYALKSGLNGFEWIWMDMNGNEWANQNADDGGIQGDPKCDPISRFSRVFLSEFFNKKKRVTLTVAYFRWINNEKSGTLDDNLNLGLYNQNLKNTEIIKDKLKKISNIIKELKKYK